MLGNLIHIFAIERERESERERHRQTDGQTDRHVYIHREEQCKYLNTNINGPRDLGSVPGGVIPKTQKMVFDASLFNAQHYKVCIKSKVVQSRERSCSLHNTSVSGQVKRYPLGPLRLWSPTTYYIYVVYSLIVLNLFRLLVFATIKRFWVMFLKIILNIIYCF